MKSFVSVLLGLALGAALFSGPVHAVERLPVRAVWVTRWACRSPEDVRELMAGLEPLGINTVFFQVRGACDALYKSAYEPWSGVLTDSLGKDPGWDPLAVAIEEAHARGMELHAWFNVFPAWHLSDDGISPPETSPKHVTLNHPAWLACDRRGEPMPLEKSVARHNYAFLSPTHANAQDHIAAVVEDLVGRYAVDGLHLDYVRFPDSSYSYDSHSKAAFLKARREEGITSFADWRRDNLTAFVGRLAYTARLVRPDTEISAAVWQKIDSGREEYFQDGIEWIRRGYVDFIVPMIYTTSAQAFENRLRTYTELAGSDRVIAGMGPYLEGFTDSLVTRQLEISADFGVRGFSILNNEHALKYASAIKAFLAEAPGD